MTEHSCAQRILANAQRRPNDQALQFYQTWARRVVTALVFVLGGIHGRTATGRPLPCAQA